MPILRPWVESCEEIVWLRRFFPTWSSSLTRREIERINTNTHKQADVVSLSAEEPSGTTTTEKRILELREWVRANSEILLREGLKHLAASSEDIGPAMAAINEKVKRQAMNQFVILPTLAREYAESAISPYYERLEADLEEKKGAETDLEVPPPTAQLPRERIKNEALMEAFRMLEGPQKGLVDLNSWMTVAVESRTVDEPEFHRALLRLTKEGIVSEAKPGLYKRVQG
jgi:hypothetical protein